MPSRKIQYKMLRVGSDIYNPEDQLKTLESAAIL